MVLKAYLYNENIFHIDLLQIMAIFVVKHFLSCYKDTISCMVKKKLPQWYFQRACVPKPCRG